MGMVGFWGSPVANRLASTADLILAVGTRFPETDSSSWEAGATFAIPPTRLIHIDIDPNEPGRNYPADLAVVADAASALAVIADQARTRPAAFPDTTGLHSRRNAAVSSSWEPTTRGRARFP